MKQPAASTFGAALKTLLEKNRITPSSLGRMIGDTTSVRRAINETLSDRMRQKVFESICSRAVFSGSELELLRESLAVSRLGMAKYCSFAALESWVQSDTERCCGHLQPNELSSLMEQFDPEAELSILCVNCLFEPVMAQFRKILHNPDRAVHIRHYLTPSPANGSISAYLAVARKLIFDLRYQALIPHNDGAVTQPLPIYGNTIILRGTVNGKPHENVLTVVSDREFFPFPGQNLLGAYKHFNSIMEHTLTCQPLIIRPSDPHDFSSTCLEFLGYEMSRKTTVFSPGLRIAMIPPAVFKAAVKPEAGLSGDRLCRMVAQHTKRFQYSNSNRKPRVMITSAQGIQQFLKTGRTQDHPSVLRMLEPEERLALLDVILRYAANNQKLSFRMLKSDAATPPCQLCCHHQLAVTFHHAGTPHRMAAPYATLMSGRFAGEMSDYLSEIVMETSCMPACESLNRLKQLRDEYAAAIKR